MKLAPLAGGRSGTLTAVMTSPGCSAVLADKTSWTKLHAGMTYGDSIVGGAREAGQTRAGLGGAEGLITVNG